MDPVSCVLCDAKLDDATAAEAPNESTSPNGPRASSGLMPSPRAKVPHVVVQSRSLEDASSPRGAPSQRPSDNSTTIARTTAKRHSKAARKARSSCPYASSWLLLPRDDASQASRVAALRLKVPVQTYDGARKAWNASGALR